MTGPPDDPRSPGRPWPVGASAPNPRSYPVRTGPQVDAQVRRAALQQHELEQTMAATGQTGALVIADLVAQAVPGGGSCTVTTWAEGPVTVLPEADVVVLFELPRTIDDQPRSTPARWDVVARVCGPTCWQVVADVHPLRVITRRWPTADQLDVVRNLSLPDLAN